MIMCEMTEICWSILSCVTEQLGERCVIPVVLMDLKCDCNQVITTVDHLDMRTNWTFALRSALSDIYLVENKIIQSLQSGKP